METWKKMALVALVVSLMIVPFAIAEDARGERAVAPAKAESVSAPRESAPAATPTVRSDVAPDGQTPPVTNQPTRKRKHLTVKEDDPETPTTGVASSGNKGNATPCLKTASECPESSTGGEGEGNPPLAPEGEGPSSAGAPLHAFNPLWGGNALSATGPGGTQALSPAEPFINDVPLDPAVIGLADGRKTTVLPLISTQNSASPATGLAGFAGNPVIGLGLLLIIAGLLVAYAQRRKK